MMNRQIIRDDQYAISTFITYHKDKWVSPAMESMIDLIKAYSEYWD